MPIPKGTRNGILLPRVLVVDDELGAVELFKGRDGLSRWEEAARKRRVRFCQQFGLISDDDDEGAGVTEPVAYASFVSGLCWSTSFGVTADPEAAIRYFRTREEREEPPPALVLLDLQFNMGAFDESNGSFQLKNLNYGTDVILPKLIKAFAKDKSVPGSSWCAIPVVIVSSLPKEALDPIIRERGARGMIGKDTRPEEARRLLRGYLEDHGLLPDERGILVGYSLAFLNCLASARRVARGDGNVLLLGESGTGKEGLARYIHDHSGRLGPYKVFHAAGRPEELQAGELFGHWKEAYTGADSDRPGLIEEANGGTLFVDEVADVGAGVQNLLLRPLQEKVAERMGRPPAGRPAEYRFDVKFLFATNKDIGSLAEGGQFRADLLSRVQQGTVLVPPLRERICDLGLLSRHILGKLDKSLQTGTQHFLDSQAREELARRNFARSNIRELENLLRDAVHAHRIEPRLTAADVSVANQIGLAPQGPSGANSFRSTQAHDLLFALIKGERQWESLSVLEAKAISSELPGFPAQLLVRLLEIALQASRSQQETVSWVRLVRQFWGIHPTTPQQAKREIYRLLAAEWIERRIAQAASESPLLMSESKMRALIVAALQKGSGDA
jgi:DNA-binding NtrC family response regulator